MKNKLHYLFAVTAFVATTLLFASCEKDYVAPTETITPVVPSISFVEEFNNVGDLTAKGWIFKNNSRPIGQSGWRQGRYESASLVQYKFLAPVPFIGFPAYSASTSPNDFISCDASSVNDALTGTGDISAWLISPQVPMKNGDQIVFYTRAVFDSDYPVFTRDRMEVRANYASGGSSDVGNTPTSVGGFTNVLLDINSTYANNDPAGYPRAWRKYTINISGLAAPVTNGRFAFRYLAADAGVFGGNGGNYPSVVGIDSLSFIHP